MDETTMEKRKAEYGEIYQNITEITVNFHSQHYFHLEHITYWLLMQALYLVSNQRQVEDACCNLINKSKKNEYRNSLFKQLSSLL